eukprot:TRINITY_DN40170_c0_g1_i1.p1 TRINITY_DN40170_c0_g1~~TRINITY_DN40170_c0_g1_i1.p1  ORF type:complete len:403 (-),score=-29.32 TRINITY_DN40170_c0_g1_i1:216-1403(-)
MAGASRISRHSIIPLFLALLSLTATLAQAGRDQPLSAKAALERFWRRQLPTVALPDFLLRHASPLNATSLAVISALIQTHKPFSNTPSVCSSANVICTNAASGTLKASNTAFKDYGQGSNGNTFDFTNYSGNSHVGDHIFKSYGKNSNGNSATFTSYSKTGDSSSPVSVVFSGGVEPGKFFRESLLSEGKKMHLPDLRSYMPPRSFLPPSLADKLRPTSANLPNLLELFGVPKKSAMEAAMRMTVAECERAPAAGETKRCVASVEAMAEFAMEVLGPRLQVLTTESAEGSREEAVVGKVVGLEGGRVTQSVSCHQSMFPFLVYYCHSVPKVRAYEAELKRKTVGATINDGVAVCHLDTSAWSASHAAFAQLGGEPGQSEVCHWIFEGDLVWVHSS